MAFLVQNLRKIGLFLVIPKLLSVSIFQAKLHSCHDMLNEIFGKIYNIVNDMCIATTKAEVYMDVPDIATAPMRKRSNFDRPNNMLQKWNVQEKMETIEQHCDFRSKVHSHTVPKSFLLPRGHGKPFGTAFRTPPLESVSMTLQASSHPSQNDVC